MQQFIEFSSKHWELWLAFLAVLVVWMTLEIRNKMVGLHLHSPQETIQLINRHEAVVLDVRDNAQFSRGHVTGAINIPLAELDAKLSQLKKYKENPIIIVCPLGESPTKIGALLQNNGFLKISCLKGGLPAWQSAGLPLVKD